MPRGPAKASPRRMGAGPGAFSPRWLAHRLAVLLPKFPNVAICVALSGGVDSVTLLAALAAHQRSGQRKRMSLRAVHVHHGLHPNADQWSEHCTRLAAQLGVPLTVLRVKVAPSRGASLEAAARDARYGALAAALEPGEVLVTAHHEDDQLETVILQLMRGAGVAGLAAMPEIASFARGQLARPLLSRSRAELEEWARAHALTWVDDDSNANEQFDRNYLRRQVLPAIRARWPSAATAVARSARHAAEAKRLLDVLARADVERAAIGAQLSVPTLRALDADRRRNALRYWIARAGFAAPDTRRLDEISGAFLDARADANPTVKWNGTTLHRHAGLLSVHAESAAARAVQPREGAEWDWHADAHFDLPAGGGTLFIEPDIHGPLDLDALPARLTIRARRGGERLRPRRGGPTKTLKALFQESRVPLADRKHVPLAFSEERLLAVGDRWFDASVHAAPGCERRARLRWQRAPVAGSRARVASIKK